MCGRYATTRSAADLSALFESSDETGGRLVADFNVAPTDPVPMVRNSQVDGRMLTVARWGLVPSWARDSRGAARMINARAETVATGKAFAASFARRRCLIPADGWYEWVRRDGAGKQPYFMTPVDGSVLAFAGLWSVWSPPDRASGAAESADPLVSCAVLTTAARGDLALVHDRMPLLLPAERWPDWLAGGGDPARLLTPPGDELLTEIEIRPVGPSVGDVRNDGPDLVVRVPAPPLAAPATETVELTLF
ncbi:SOS response-associated peptidase [Micromonospora zhanjiangensis]|uniref:Abasic site processing protein n=1 Tax=Micromonospora zhanjiangensis TaxID=1522057 RepID=A0ABV8KLF3_9ACTN